MPIEYNPLVTFVHDAAAPCRRELHARNADEPSSLPAPWVLLTAPAVGAPCHI